MVRSFEIFTSVLQPNVLAAEQRPKDLSLSTHDLLNLCVNMPPTPTTNFMPFSNLDKPIFDTTTSSPMFGLDAPSIFSERGLTTESLPTDSLTINGLPTDRRRGALIDPGLGNRHYSANELSLEKSKRNKKHKLIETTPEQTKLKKIHKKKTNLSDIDFNEKNDFDDLRNKTIKLLFNKLNEGFKAAAQFFLCANMLDDSTIINTIYNDVQEIIKVFMNEKKTLIAENKKKRIDQNDFDNFIYYNRILEGEINNIQDQYKLDSERVLKELEFNIETIINNINLNIDNDQVKKDEYKSWVYSVVKIMFEESKEIALTNEEKIHVINTLILPYDISMTNLKSEIDNLSTRIKEFFKLSFTKTENLNKLQYEIRNDILLFKNLKSFGIPELDTFIKIMTNVYTNFYNSLNSKDVSKKFKKLEKDTTTEIEKLKFDSFSNDLIMYIENADKRSDHSRKYFPIDEEEISKYFLQNNDNSFDKNNEIRTNFYKVKSPLQWHLETPSHEKTDEETIKINLIDLTSLGSFCD